MVPSDLGAGPPPRSHRRGPAQLLRAAFLVVVLAFAAYYLWSQRQQVRQAWQHVSLLAVLGAVVASALGAWSGVPAWRDLLVGLGSRLRWRDAQRVFLMGQLGKYVPGGVWTVAAQATMAKDLHVPRSRSGTASLLSIMLSVLTASALGAVCLAVAGHEVIGRYWWLPLFAVPLLGLLHPEVLVRAGALVSRVTRRDVALARVPERTLLAAAGWLLGGQVAYGLGFWFLVDTVAHRSTDPLLSIGLFGLASAAGIVVIFLPAGLGAREVVLAFGLGTITDAGSAALIVLLSRSVLTVVDVALAAAAAGLGRHPRLPAPAAP